MGDRGGGEVDRYAEEDAGFTKVGKNLSKQSVKAGLELATGQKVGVYQTTGQDFKTFRATDASTTNPSAIATKFGLSDQQRQATFNQQALADAKRHARDVYGPGDDPTIYREEKRKKAEEEAAAAAAAAEEEKTAATTTGADTTAATTGTTTTAVDTAQTDYSKLLADMQTKYDAQLAAFQSEMDAATQQQADQLAKLTEATAAHKKKLKKSGKKFGRLSLLFGSELGIPKTTTLGG